MMSLGRERRLNCRLYVDRQADAAVVEKLDRLLAEKHFLNQTELIKHGIELAYGEVYEDKGVPGKVVDSGTDVQVLAELLVDVLKPELQQTLAGLETRIMEGVTVVNADVVGAETVGDNALIEAVVSVENEPATTVQESEKEPIAEVREEKSLSGAAISFWKGLNDDGDTILLASEWWQEYLNWRHSDANSITV